MRTLRNDLKAKMHEALTELRNMQRVEDALEAAEVLLLSSLITAAM